MHCKKCVICLRIGVIHLEKCPEIKGNNYLCPNQVRYCMELTNAKNVFTPFAKTPVRVISEVLG